MPCAMLMRVAAAPSGPGRSGGDDNGVVIDLFDPHRVGGARFGCALPQQSHHALGLRTPYPEGPTGRTPSMWTSAAPGVPHKRRPGVRQWGHDHNASGRAVLGLRGQNWHFRVPALHINGGGKPTREEAQRACFEAIALALKGDPADYDPAAMVISFHVTVAPPV
jgi:hypothetical protein